MRKALFSRWTPKKSLYSPQDSARHSNLTSFQFFESLWRLFGWILALHILSVQVSQTLAQTALQNTTISIADPDSGQVVYTPFFCDVAMATAEPERCAGAWREGRSDTGLPIVMSAGLNSSTGNILPQIFFRFRASTVYLTMDPTSNATINVTMSSDNITIMNTLRASLGVVTIVRIPQEALTTLTITLLPSSSPILFTLNSVVITTPLNAESTSIFPTPTLPAPTPVSTWFNPSTTSFATATITMPAPPGPAPDRRKMIAQAVGITVGLGIGLTAGLTLAFFYWKKRRRIARLWGPSQSRVEFD